MEVKVGECVVDSDGGIVKLERQFYGQGMIFKDEHAFYHELKAPLPCPGTVRHSVYQGRFYEDVQ